MIKNIKNMFLGVVAAMMLVAVPVVAISTPVSAAELVDCVGQGAELDGDLTGECKPGDSTTGGANITDLITTIVNVISIIVGVIAVIMIIFGGLKYITSGGDSNKITAAKNTIMYALIGLVVVALAQFIVRFVLSKTAGVVSGTGA